MRGLVGMLLLAAVLGAVGRGLVAAPRGAPERFPAHVLPPGKLPALWGFVRAECSLCRQHLQSLAAALSHLSPAERRRVAAQLHIVGDLRLESAWQHPRCLHEAFAVRSTPLTWWVGRDARIERAWLGSRDEAAWARALAFVQNETVLP